MKNKRILSWIMTMGIVIAGMEVCAGCKKGEVIVPDSTRFDVDFNAMDTYMTLTAYGKNAESGLEKAKTRIQEVEGIFSVTDENSDIYKINHRETEQIAISDEVMNVLGEALTISERTSGNFDISIYPVLREWGFTTGEYQVPEESVLQELLQKVDYTKISVDSDEKTVTLADGMEVDFGAIAKGYSGDMAVAALKEAEVTSALLNLGGNIQALGEKPDGSSWNVAIKDPVFTSEYMGVLSVKDKAVITSGGYERYFEDRDGNTWSHIIDPSTGYSADSGTMSITIVGTSGMEADALSTAMYVSGIEKASEYWKTYGGFDMVIITKEEEVYVTEGIKEDFTLMGNYKDKQVHIIEK